MKQISFSRLLLGGGVFLLLLLIVFNLFRMKEGYMTSLENICCKIKKGLIMMKNDPAIMVYFGGRAFPNEPIDERFKRFACSGVNYDNCE